jgi:hypothetical protein
MDQNASDMWENIKIKADLLCMGIRHNNVAEEIYRRQNPCEDWKTGNVGLHISLENGSHVLVTSSHSFDSESIYSIEYCKSKDHREKQLVLLKEQEIVHWINEVPMPKWYLKSTTENNKLMPDVFLHEGLAFLHQTYSGCDYHYSEEPSENLRCKFCGTGRKWKFSNPTDVGETVSEAVKENPKYHVCLGGGTKLPLDRNVGYFKDCIKAIRARVPNVPIWVEMVPPESDNDIQKLVDEGATSFGFNIEFWNEE